jgi:hypothetical protein
VSWTGEPIGLVINDFPHDAETSQNVLDEMLPYLVPNAILVFCQYGAPHASSLREFLAGRARQLAPLHVLSSSPLASFLFTP